VLVCCVSLSIVLYLNMIVYSVSQSIVVYPNIGVLCISANRYISYMLVCCVSLSIVAYSNMLVCYVSLSIVVYVIICSVYPQSTIVICLEVYFLTIYMFRLS